MQYLKLHSANEIYESLVEFEACFPHMKEKIPSLKEFSEKLHCNAEVYIAREGENNLGFVAFYANDQVEYCGYITLIGVLEKYRHKGIGKKILFHALDEMKNKCMKKCKLEVDKDNYSAQTFYNKTGFIKTEEKPSSFYMEKEI